MDDKILKKIKKCLRLAASSNAHEASNALRAAQRMMKQYGVCAADVEISDVNKSESMAFKAKTMTTWQGLLIHTINRVFGTEATLKRYRLTSGGWRTQVSFYGIDSNPELAGYALAVVYRQVMRERKAFISNRLSRANKREKTRSADIFTLSLVSALNEKIQELNRSEHEISLIQKAMEQFKKGTIDNYRSVDASRADYTAAMEGMAASQNIKINTPVHGNSSTQHYLEESL